MNIEDFQKAQGELERGAILRAKEGLSSEQAAALDTHVWSLDISDMVWECGRCLAVLHAGQRRFNKCSGRWGV